MNKKLFCFFLIGFSLLGAEEYYYSREWLNLLYYAKTLTGYQSSAMSADFFVSEKGRENPRLEYETSLQLVKEKDIHFKTKFPLRYKYIARQNDLKYEPVVVITKNVTNIILAYPNRYIQNPVSMFGHVFLALETDRGLLDSRILHYVADTRGDQQGLAYALKGLTGGYKGAFYAEDYYKKIKEYNYLEDREVLLYDLKFSPEQIEDLQLHYLELQNTFFYYYFLDANCAFYIGKFLNVVLAKDILSKPVYTMPAALVNNLRAEGLLENERTRPTATKTFNYLYNLLDNRQKAQVRTLLTAKAKDLDADPETLKTFLTISEFMISNHSELAEIIRQNRIWAYKKLNENNEYQIRPARQAAERVQKINYHSAKFSWFPKNFAGLEFNPIHFLDDDEQEIKNVRLLGISFKSCGSDRPRYGFDLLEIDNLTQSNLLLPAVSWSAKSQFSWQNDFATNQELYLGYAFNILNNGLLYILLGGNYANYDNRLRQNLDNLYLTMGGKIGVKQKLFDNCSLLLAYENQRRNDYRVAELTYSWQDLLGKL
ncbi:protein DUF4105, partial [Candidatus Termititenax aidoneus]